MKVLDTFPARLFRVELIESLDAEDGSEKGLFQPHLGRGNSLETTELGEVERPEDMIEISFFFFFFSFAPEDPLTQAFLFEVSENRQLIFHN